MDLFVLKNLSISVACHVMIAASVIIVKYDLIIKSSLILMCSKNIKYIIVVKSILVVFCVVFWFQDLKRKAMQSEDVKVNEFAIVSRKKLILGASIYDMLDIISETIARIQ